MTATACTLVVRERLGVARCGEIVTAAVPCPPGNTLLQGPLCIIAPHGGKHPCQIEVLKRWPDGAAKWLLVDFPASAAANDSSTYQLAAGNAPAVPDAIHVRQGKESWEVQTGSCTFAIDPVLFAPFREVRVSGRSVLRWPGSVCLIGTEDSRKSADIESITLEQSGLLHAVVRLEGSFGGTGIRFFSRLHFFAGSSAVRIEFTVHNQAPARHRGGLWDLGDAGSFFFKSLSFSFSSASDDGETCCVPSPGGSPLVCPAGARFALYQESSGGGNWRSPVHRNCAGQVPMNRCGYLAAVDGREVATGRRATPLLWHGTGDRGIAVAYPQFWENFPAELGADGGRITVLPYPESWPDLHELQGGEQKTHEFWIDFSARRDGLAWALNPLLAQATPEQYRASTIFHDLPADNDLVDSFTTAADLAAKREQADEYGWRNFGEIHADHEAAYHEGPETFVSHYNNQYDFLGGLYRKFFATGEVTWKDLAQDLARHVRDIDIYHTEEDREEYNNGLFWHTDHYLDAGNSTHRSFSKAHLQVKRPQFCGGGPGAEHCYTTGLMLHYFQTGNPDFRNAVIALAKWELVSLAGPQTVLAAIKRGIGTLSRWRYAEGATEIFSRYPLTRGTGNAITACLDAFEVGGGEEFLARAEELIRGTVHPDDDISARDLLNPEIRWSYTVFLVAVAKYLEKKVELKQLDDGFRYARASLLAYTEWMRQHEYPYLDKPELLEFPNETWAAQDLRKSVILYHAARFAATPLEREAYRTKAASFYETSVTELRRHASSSYARPVVLMLQNGWVGSRLEEHRQPVWAEEREEKRNVGAGTPSLSLPVVARRMAADLSAAFRHSSLSREWAWLRARLT